MNMKSNPYVFYDSGLGHSVDWSAYIGEICPLLTGHNKPATKDEIAVLVSKKQRECNFFGAMRALRDSGESCEARSMFYQFFGK
jgi:hypothetical protein